MARVLIVDDSADVHEALQLGLTATGFEVTSAFDALEGLQLTAEIHPDVILLDMMMPEMDGLAFLSRLATLPSPPPVVANSGFDAFRTEALRRGAHAFLLKPFSIDTLVAALQSAMAHRPLPSTEYAANAAIVERARLTGLQASSAVVSSIDANGNGMSALRENLRRVTRWMSNYFGFGQSLVTILRGSYLNVEAKHNGGSLRFNEGERYPREDFYCDEVIAAGSTLVLTDPVHHPCERFARHRSLQYGVEFYAGVPLKTPSGAVLGTLCVVHDHPHEFSTEDMRVLEALGLAVARGLETGVWALDEDGAYRSEYFDLFVDVAARRAAREGGAGFAMSVERAEIGAPVPRAKGLAVVKLDGRLALVWGGRRGEWTPPAAVSKGAGKKVEVTEVKDRATATARLRTVAA